MYFLAKNNSNILVYFLFIILGMGLHHHHPLIYNPWTIPLPSQQPIELVNQIIETRETIVSE